MSNGAIARSPIRMTTGTVASMKPVTWTNGFARNDVRTLSSS